MYNTWVAYKRSNVRQRTGKFVWRGGKLHVIARICFTQAGGSWNASNIPFHVTVLRIRDLEIVTRKPCEYTILS